MIQVVSFPMVVSSAQQSAAESYTFHARVAILAFITTMAHGLWAGMFCCKDSTTRNEVRAQS